MFNFLTKYNIFRQPLNTAFISQLQPKDHKSCKLFTWCTCERETTWCCCDCNGTQTYNHLVCKWTLNHLAKRYKTHISASPGYRNVRIQFWEASTIFLPNEIKDSIKINVLQCWTIVQVKIFPSLYFPSSSNQPSQHSTGKKYFLLPEWSMHTYSAYYNLSELPELTNIETFVQGEIAEQAPSWKDLYQLPWSEVDVNLRCYVQATTV